MAAGWDNPLIGLDIAHSRGSGVLVVGKKGVKLTKVFPGFNNSKQAIALVEYLNCKSLILGAFHLDIKEKKLEAEKLLLLLQEVQRKFSLTDVLFYTDLDLHQEDKTF